MLKFLLEKSENNFIVKNKMDNEVCEKFWLERPIDLFSTFDILPEKSMCTGSKLNAATRLAFVISAVLYLSKIDEWKIFFFGTMAMLIVAFFICRKNEKREGYSDVQVLNPVWFHDQSTPIESVVDNMCDDDYELVDNDVYTNDVEYIDSDYKPRRYFGVSKLMPDEEDRYDGFDRRQLQRINTEKYADRIVESREASVSIFKKEIQERFEPDEYYESY